MKNPSIKGLSLLVPITRFMLTGAKDICLYRQFRLCLFWIRIEMSPSEG